MLLITVITVVFVASALITAVVGISRMHRARGAATLEQQSAMRDVARLIQGISSETVAVGTLEGFKTEAEYVVRGSGSGSEGWTEIRVQIGSIAMELALREDDLATRLMVKQSGAVDVRVGDPFFDRTFLVDGAPAHAVAHVLADRHVREMLIALAPLELTQERERLILAKRGWLLSERLLPATRIAARLATRMHEAVRLLPTTGGQGEVPRKLAPYRNEGMVATDERDEVEHLLAGRERFRQLKTRVSYGVLALLLIAIALLAASGGAR